MTLTKEQKSERVLLVLYRLSHGSPGISVQTKALLEEINRLGVMKMSEPDFQQFKLKTTRKFRKVNPN